MINNTPLTMPLTIVAQLDDVTVYQSNACHKDVDLEDSSQSISHQRMLKAGQASYSELNLGLHVGDDALKVLTNRMRLLTAINEHLTQRSSLPINRLHWAHQVHGTQVLDVDSSALSVRPVDADAMVSQQPKLGLAIMTADCVPIVLYQPASGKIAAIHAGWQGLARGVIQATAQRFTIKAPIMAWIGVCISQDNYEVDYQVRDKLLAGCTALHLLSSADIDRFDEWFVAPSNPSSPSKRNPDSIADGKPLQKTVDKLSNNATVAAHKIKLNLPKLAIQQLEHTGIVVSNKTSIACSYADASYYSYRRQTHLQQPATGRMALIITRSLPNEKP